MAYIDKMIKLTQKKNKELDSKYQKKVALTILFSDKKYKSRHYVSGDFVVDNNGDLNSYLNQSNCSDTDLRYFEGYEKELHKKPLRD